MTQNMRPSENYQATLLARSRVLRHCPHPHHDAAADHVRTLVVDSTGRFHVGLPGRKRRVHTQERVFGKAVGSPYAVRMCPSVHWFGIRCNGPQHIRSWDQCHHGGWARRLMPGGSDFPYHRRSGRRIRPAPKGYIEDNQVPGGRSMVDYMQA